VALGSTVQLAQLRHLLTVLSTNDRVTLQVTPFSGPLHLGHSTPYTIIDFAHPLDTTIVQQENAVSSFSDAQPEVRRWDYVFDNLMGAAHPDGSRTSTGQDGAAHRNDHQGVGTMRAPPDVSPLDTATWRKASFSNPDNGCVDVARPAAPVVGIRDSKAPHAGRLTVAPAAFNALLDLVKP